MVEDTALSSQKFEDLKERLRTVTGDVKASEEKNEELESSLRVLKEDNDRLGRRGAESQQVLSAESKKLTQAYSCTVLWTQTCQRQESKTQAAEAEASDLRQQNKTLQDSVKDLSESVRDIESELAQEKRQTRAVQETQKYWSDKRAEVDSEYQEALEQRDAEVAKSKLLKSDLDTARIVSKKHQIGRAHV